MTEDLKTYAITLFLSAALMLASAVALNAVIDPYGMYRFYEREGFNAVKPATYTRVRLLKAYEARRLRPESIVLGTSRVHLGISPRHAGWTSLYGNRYNLAFDGATTKEMYAYLKHAYASGRLKHALLGLDTYHLSTAPGNTRPDFDPGLLMNEYNAFNILRMLAADFKLLTSISTLKESFATLRAQTDPQPSWLSPDGQRLGDVFFRRPFENFIQCGPRCYFDEIDKLEVRFKLEWKIPGTTDNTVNAGPPTQPDPLNSLDYIKKIVEFCRDHDIKLIVFLTPSHAHQLELDALTDNWWSVENGKREIIKILAEDAQDHPDKTEIPLYDFTAYSTITTEKLPPEDSRQEMRYYWDSSHFKENVGDMVLDCILETQTVKSRIPNDFCVKLGSGNIKDIIETLNQKQKIYRSRHEQEISVIKNSIHAFKSKHGIP